MNEHKPVLIEEVAAFFADMKMACFCDGTLGLGGHARRILEEHPEIEEFFGIDRDDAALSIAKEVLSPFDCKLHLIHGDYVDLPRHLQSRRPDGIFLDLGVSSLQLDQPERGFSFRHDAPLDMRMDRRSPMTAAKAIMELGQKELEEVFKEYGEEPRWRQAAKAVVEARRKKPVKTTLELRAVLLPVLRKGGRIDPLTRVFQALRIYVNSELEVLQKGLLRAISCLPKDGLLGVIAFHSLEDRIVKNTFRECAKEGKILLLTKKPKVPTREEIRHNRRARSAKMRFAKKI